MVLGRRGLGCVRPGYLSWTGDPTHTCKYLAGGPRAKTLTERLAAAQSWAPYVESVVWPKPNNHSGEHDC